MGGGGEERVTMSVDEKWGVFIFWPQATYLAPPPPSVFFEDSSKHVLKYSYLKVMDRYIIY